MLETAWTAFEDAGHVPSQAVGRIGAFVACGRDEYWHNHQSGQPDAIAPIGNSSDRLAQSLAAAFGLTGPSVGIQSGASSSLTAIHLAAASLRAGECDLALAGGVRIALPQGRGWLGKNSDLPVGSGVGAVILRRLEDALEDGDHVVAILDASAIGSALPDLDRADIAHLTVQAPLEDATPPSLTMSDHFGDLGAAAGVASVIATSLTMEATGPACVSANGAKDGAFALLSPAPDQAKPTPLGWPVQILTVSGASDLALKSNCQALAAHLRASPEADLADVAFTLQAGRHGFAHRRAIVAANAEDAAERLDALDWAGTEAQINPEILFLFGDDAGVTDGGLAALYYAEPVFADTMDRALTEMHALGCPVEPTVWLDGKLPSKLIPARTMAAQTALAKLWLGWGISPAALAGTDLGLWSAACVAGVITLKAGLELAMAQDPAAQTSLLRAAALASPNIPMLAPGSRQIITDTQATDPAFWVSQNQSEAQAPVWKAQNTLCLPIGFGLTQSAVLADLSDLTCLPGLCKSTSPADAQRAVFEMLGQIWAHGGAFDWGQIWMDRPGRRLSLPGYVFQQASYLIEPVSHGAISKTDDLVADDDMTNWVSLPAWKPKTAPIEFDITAGLDLAEPQTWLMFMDDAGLARRCAQRLTAAGHTVIEVRAGDLFSRTGDKSYVVAPEHGFESYDLMLRDALSRGLVPNRIAHFWMVTQDESHRAGSSFFHRLEEQGFYSLLHIAQAVAAHDLTTPVHMSVITNTALQTGDEGLPYPAKALITGPVRVIPREMPGVSVAQLDIPLPEPMAAKIFFRKTEEDRFSHQMESLVHTILEDLLAEPFNEVAALRSGRRLAQTTRAQRLPASDGLTVSSDDSILITGGFGRIGLSLARSFAKQGAKLALLSRTGLPARDQWTDLKDTGTADQKTRIAAVEQLEADGASVMVLTADMANPVALQNAADEMRSQFGKITGVVHAAGAVEAARIGGLSTASVEKLFAPKVLGTETLLTVFPDGSVNWMVLCGSALTAMGAEGHAADVASNAFLSAVAQSHSAGQTKVLALNWGPWEAMADQAPETDQDATAAKFTFLGQTGDGVNSLGLSLPSHHWLLAEHRSTSGTALLPGAAYLSLAVQALQEMGRSISVELSDALIYRPVIAKPGETRSLTVKLKAQGNGYGFDVLSDGMFEGQPCKALTAQGNIQPIQSRTPSHVDVPALKARCGKAIPAPAKPGQHQHMVLGQRWAAVETLRFGALEACAELTLPAASSEDSAFLLHPAFLDAATGWMTPLIGKGADAAFWAPVGYGKTRIYRKLPAKVIAWAKAEPGMSASNDTAQFDLRLLDTEGRVCIEFEGLSLRRFDDMARLENAPALSRSDVVLDSEGQASASGQADVLARWADQGISDDAAPEILARAWSLPAPEVFVSPVPLADLRSALDKAAPKSGLSAITTEETNQKARALPETETEAKVLTFWEQLLGLKDIGIDDSFFDLGGHSLIAVRLFAMIRKTYRVEFPISVLFEAPTIRNCAAMIDQKRASLESGEPEDAQAESFNHVVAMHDGVPGDGLPLFVVAGCFGNVLNLRHFGQLMGQDRPCYGLQAKGLYGGETPHQTFEEAAADYIAEMKRVQPKGPYLIGGFSGGGVTAWEVAQQLRANGDEVAALIQLDAALPRRRPLSAVDRALIQVAEFKRKGVKYPFIWARNRIHWELTKNRGTFAAAESDHQLHNAEVEAGWEHGASVYQVRDYDGRFIIFRPPMTGHWTVSNGQLVDHQRSYVFHDNDWGQYAPQVEVYEVPGDHDSIVLEPNVRVLAAQLRDILNGVDRVSDAGNGVPDIAQARAAE
jgi:acyl transferase domain-containing protein/thioesterase domain-containing protein/acyl carrier protein